MLDWDRATEEVDLNKIIMLTPESVSLHKEIPESSLKLSCGCVESRSYKYVVSGGHL